MALTQFHYDKRYRYYDGERRDRNGPLTYYGQVDGEFRNGWDFTDTYVQHFILNVTDTTTETVTRSLANGVNECIKFLSIENEDSSGYDLHFARYLKDKNGHIIGDIYDPPNYIQLNFPDQVVHINKEYNPDKTALDLYFTAPLLHYRSESAQTELSVDDEAVYMHTLSELFVIKYTYGGVKPELNQYYSFSFFGDYYETLVNSQITSDHLYELYNDKLVKGGDGTPITPILPSEDPSQPGGGDQADPDYNPFSDPVDFPGLPTGGSAIASGFIRVYSPTAGQLQSLAGKLWGNDFVNTIHKIMNDPMEAMISLHSVPFQIVGGSNANIEVGNFDTEVSAKTVTSQYYTLDCGNISLPEHWASALDYSPYTTVDIFIPFVGVRPLQIDDVMGRVLNLKYNIDILTGCAIAMLKCGDSVLYTYNTQIHTEIPYTMSSYGRLVQSIIGVAGTAIGATAGGAGALIGASIGGALGTAMTKHSDISRGGSLGGAVGVMGDFTPYLIIHRPIQSLASDFASKKGYPSNISATLSSVSGYTVVDKIHLTDIDCTDTERDEIHALLKEGVII